MGLLIGRHLFQLVAHLQGKYFEAETARESLLAKVEALEATAANLNASVATICGNMGSLSQSSAKDGDAADGDAVDASVNSGSIATQTSFLGEVQEQLKVFQSQFTAIKDTVQGETDSLPTEQSKRRERVPLLDWSSHLC